MAETPEVKPNNGSKSNTLLTPEIIEQICNHVAIGAWYQTAAKACGISRLTLNSWRKLGKEAKNKKGKKTEREVLCIKLVDDLEQALALAEINDLERIDNAAEQGVWQAAAWRLERRFPERWGTQKEALRELNKIIERLRPLYEKLTNDSPLPTVASEGPTS